MAKRIFVFFSLCWIAMVACGCATIYYPLKKDAYFNDEKRSDVTVGVLPFQTEIFTFYTKMNTAEMVDKKAKEADRFVAESLKEVLRDKGYQIVWNISMEETERKDFDEGLLDIINDFYGEFSEARYSFQKNLKDDAGKPFDYSIGFRTLELRDKLTEKPDLFMIVVPYGYISNVNILNPLNQAAMAICTLGLNFIAPTPDDSVCYETALLESKSGSILWFNAACYPAQSYLICDHAKNGLSQNLTGLPEAKKK